jgi:hypothetical protein
MVHGQWIVRGGELITGDTAHIAKEQNRQSERLLFRWRGATGLPY